MGSLSLASGSSLFVGIRVRQECGSAVGIHQPPVAADSQLWFTVHSNWKSFSMCVVV